jgi:hypothetical protein
MSALFPPVEIDRSFGLHYRERVIPRLEEAVIRAATDVVWGDAGYTAAFGGVWCRAWRSGASQLSEDQQHQLADWLHAQLAEEIFRQERQQDTLDRVGNDVANWNQAIMEAFSNAE